MRHYCDTDGCLATYPCQLHTTMEEMLEDFSLATYVPPDPVVRESEEIRVVYVIPLPCGHNYPVPSKNKKFVADCDYCESMFWTELKEDVCELTRIA